jgi:hypothetical protein
MEAFDWDALEIDSRTRRRIVRVYVQPGKIGRLSASQMVEGCKLGLAEISKVANVDFVYQDRESGSQLRIRPATDEMMWRWFPKWRPGKSPQWPNGAVPLGAQKGNQIYLTVRDRWGITLTILTATIVHEAGHFFRLRYTSPDPIHSKELTDIMHAHLPVMQMSGKDVSKFQGRLGARA